MFRFFDGLREFSLAYKKTDGLWVDPITDGPGSRSYTDLDLDPV